MQDAHEMEDGYHAVVTILAEDKTAAIKILSVGTDYDWGQTSCLCCHAIFRSIHVNV